MSLVINHNTSAINTAGELSKSYAQLAKSTKRLSSGLRVNSAADDAAGLAIRELMRSDITALHQGMRNTNDAISMLQTADGALAIIDEKLIRMKELAEQAATGTYDSVQRMMIDSEFQQMASEIDRIARATDFNGIKLLDGPYASTSGAVVDPTTGTVTHTYDATLDEISIVDTSAGGQGTFVQVSSEEILANLANPSQILGTTNITVSNDNTSEITLSNGSTGTVTTTLTGSGASDPSIANKEITLKWDGDSWVTDAYNLRSSSVAPVANDYDSFSNGINVYITSSVIAEIRVEVNPSGAVPATNAEFTTTLFTSSGSPAYKFKAERNGSTVAEGILSDGSGLEINGNQLTFSIDLGNNNKVDYKFTVDNAVNAYSLSQFSGKLRVRDTANSSGGNSGTDGVSEIPDSVVKIHFGSGNDSAEDYYYINKFNATTTGLGIGSISVSTQDNAQKALNSIDKAIVKKDNIRAYYGAMQNRLENTMTNLSGQSQNLQAAESRISDADIAMEMTNFVRNQILTQSAVAMLAQANSMPQMAMRLIA